MVDGVGILKILGNSSLVIIKFGWWIAHCYGYVYRMKGLKRCSRIALTAKKPVSDIIDITVAGMLQQLHAIHLFELFTGWL